MLLFGALIELWHELHEGSARRLNKVWITLFARRFIVLLVLGSVPN